MAGIPESVIERANELLKQLEESHRAEEIGGSTQGHGSEKNEGNTTPHKSLSRRYALPVQINFS